MDCDVFNWHDNRDIGTRVGNSNVNCENREKFTLHDNGSWMMTILHDLLQGYR